MTSPEPEKTSPPAPPAPGSAPAPATIGPGGCLGGFVAGGLTLWGAMALLSLLPVRGGLRTGLELVAMGLALGACLFFWKVAATADRMAREREEEEAPPADED